MLLSGRHIASARGLNSQRAVAATKGVSRVRDIVHKCWRYATAGQSIAKTAAMTGYSVAQVKRICAGAR